MTELNNKTIICDQCKQLILHPGLMGVHLRYRANVGLEDGLITGFVEVELEGDFCDATCLHNFGYIKALGKDPTAAYVDQKTFIRE